MLIIVLSKDVMLDIIIKPFNNTPTVSLPQLFSYPEFNKIYSVCVVDCQVLLIFSRNLCHPQVF